MSRHGTSRKRSKIHLDPAAKELQSVKKELVAIKATMAKPESKFEQPIVVKQKLGIAGALGLILSVATIVATVVSFSLTAQSLQKEEISQFFTDANRVHFEVTYAPGADGNPTASDHASYFSTVVTNTGRLPITVIGFLTGPEKEAGEVDEVLWVRMQDTSNTVSSGPFVLAPGEAVAVRQRTIGQNFNTNLVLRQSDGRSVEANILDSGGNTIPSSIRIKFDALDQEWEKSLLGG